MMGKTVALVVVLALVVGSIVYLESQRAEIPESPEAAAPADGGQQQTGTVSVSVQDKASMYKLAPELIPTGDWINSEPFKLADLAGKVVLVDFWTYSCINCIRTLPYLTSWYAKYKDAGFVIVGVHTPEFEFERVLENVQRAVEKHGIEYPVVQDNDYRTWRAYRNQYWPRKYLVDIDGFIRYDHIGEGAYAETEETIQELLKERMDRMGEEMEIEKPIETPAEAVPVEFGKIRTPELYFGYNFRRHVGGNKEGYAAEQTVAYAEPAATEDNIPYVIGTWTNKPDYMQLESDTGKVLLTYNAKAVNIVASAEPGSTVEVLVDGKPADANAGDDVVDSKVSVTEDRLYTVVFNEEYGQHDLELRITGKGFRIYTFTFG